MDINFYNIYKYFHIVFLTTWMAGLFYLPRIFVYHSRAKIGSTEYKTFMEMEKKLMKYIMNPSLYLTWFFGISLVVHQNINHELWLVLKVLLVGLMTIFHMYCAKIRKKFETKRNKESENFYRIINEIPTILFLLIVFLVVFKPFI